jgi:hypothetical protein
VQIFYKIDGYVSFAFATFARLCPLSRLPIWVALTALCPRELSANTAQAVLPIALQYVIKWWVGSPMKTFQTLAFIAMLAGCTTAPTPLTHDQRMKANLDPWVGKTIAEYAATRGSPTSSFDVDKSKKVFEWDMTQQVGGAAVTLSNGMSAARSPQQLFCQVLMTATSAGPATTLANWRIEEYHWRGDC